MKIKEFFDYDVKNSIIRIKVHCKGETREKMNKDIQIVEKDIDEWIYNKLDGSIPRYKYIYHCNLAFTDIVVEQKMIFSSYEKHYLFSLTYNTHIAHMKLAEEEKFDYSLDKEVYRIAFDMIIKGMQYSMLCDIFPLLYSNKATMNKKNDNIAFDIKNIPRRNYKFIEDYTLRQSLSYMLQMGNGKYIDENDDEIALKLANIYMHFWNENMLYDDFEPYSRLDWGGIAFFFLVAAMRRYNKLYKKDFNILELGIAEMMIVLSPNGVKQLREFSPTNDEKLYNKALDDNIYKPIGKGTYPKLSICDAPLNRTKDGFVFANPLVILFSNSLETRFLNYLRKCDNPRYLNIKDKIKERVIPLIGEMIKIKVPTVICIPNFYVKIPNSTKNRRECDLLLVSEDGFALYVEIKHYYYPQSFCETKILDKELSKALEKMPKQLEAISKGWDTLRKSYNIQTELKEIEGVVASHLYPGYDVEIDTRTPIVSIPTLFESIAEATSLRHVYQGCREIDEIYPTVKFIHKPLEFTFAQYKFEVEMECLEPRFEYLFNKHQKKQIGKIIKSPNHKNYTNVVDLARAYLAD